MSTPPIDLGNDVVITYLTHDQAGNLIGLVEQHPRPDGGGTCEGGVAFDTPEARVAYGARGAFWTVESWEPLTLSPSLLCRTCGHHGFIKGGKWVPA